MLDRAMTLRNVYLEARRQKGTLDGIQACTGLESLILVNYSIGNTDPLRGLDAISELKLLAAKPTPAHEPLDLSAITSPVLAKLWISNARQLIHIDSLSERPSLRELRLIGCELSEADLRVVSELPKRVSVQLVKG
jgi:hypothetical protein